MKTMIATTALASIFLFSTSIWADGNHTPPTIPPRGEPVGIEATEHLDHSDGGNSSEHGAHDIIDNQADAHLNMDTGHVETQTGHTEDADESEHGHQGPVIETPPNYKVLGTFGAINLAFILFGIWNKWFRRNKGVASCQS